MTELWIDAGAPMSTAGISRTILLLLAGEYVSQSEIIIVDIIHAEV